MTYPIDFEGKLGFDQLRQKLDGYCLSTLGKRKVQAIQFTTDYSSVKRMLHEGLEFKSIRQRGETFPLSHCFDPTELYPLISIDDSFIEVEPLREIALSLETISGCRKFLTIFRESCPYIFELSSKVTLRDELQKTIDSKFDDAGHIKDNATPELLKIRKKLKEEEHKARKLVDHLFREAVANGIVPEGMTPVIREGRVVIPIQAEHKRRIKGLIVDESATGQTVFLEPAEVIEANNEIRDLELAERREVVKVLKDLTRHLRESLTELKGAFVFLAELDFLQAKTKLALEIEADMPQVVNEPALDWIQARHPLLYLSHKGKGDVVPLNIDLTRNDPFLLVSGPNAGGKSVCLKTVGLIQYMAQCGLLVPLHEKSTVGIFEKIFLDIGDQQSIENDLSTYSSHLRNMKFFVRNASASTLLLMDELGAGTDPNFGGGIAEAILQALVEKKVWGVATTHYYSLKLFAESQRGIRNAAMQFDSKRLEPLFVLEIGKPGSSFALEIARKTGLPEAILETAKKNIGKELAGLEMLMKKVADEKQSIAKRESAVKEQELKHRELLNRYNQLTKELEDRKKEILSKAKDEAAQLLKQTNREIEKTIRHIKENRAEKKETRKVRQGLRELEGKIGQNREGKSTKVVGPVKEGDPVRLEGQLVTGIVLSIKGTLAVVQFGEMRSKVKLSQLVRADKQEAVPRTSRARDSGLDLLSKQSAFNTTLDVRGKRAEEILPVVDQFLDDAVLLGQGHLKILHGKGEGVLRKLIRERLKQNKAVASFGDEHVDRGGAGITLVVLK